MRLRIIKNGEAPLMDMVGCQAKIHIRIEETKATLIPRTEYDRFKTEFSGSEALWNNLKAYIFTRDEYDVEHITVIGVNSETYKVQGLYAN